MSDYITPPIVTEPDDLAADAFDYLQAVIDGWEPSPGNLDVWQIEAIAQLASELAYVASAVPTSIFRYYGESLLGIAPEEAVAAYATTTWTVRDALGYTIPQGTLVGIPAAGDELIPFAVAQDTIVPAGASSLVGVVVNAEDAGTDANGLTGAPQLVDALDWVVSVVLDGPMVGGVPTTVGGLDAESDADYLNRLRQTFTVLAPRPILPNDFAILAATVPGVFRATAIDLYNPGPPPASNVPRCVTVVVVGENGAPVSTTTKQAVDSLLQSQREVNFLVFVVDPTYTTINVTFTVHPYPNYAANQVVADAVQGVKDYLNPENFGLVPYGDTPLWLPDDKVRYLEVAEAINRVEGVWYVGTLTVNGGTVDVVLAAPGPMPQAGAINGSAV